MVIGGLGLRSATLAGNVSHTPQSGIALGTSVLTVPLTVPQPLVPNSTRGFGLSSWRVQIELPWVKQQPVAAAAPVSAAAPAEAAPAEAAPAEAAAGRGRQRWRLGVWSIKLQTDWKFSS